MKKLSERQLDVMNVLWASDKPLIASDIVSKSNLSINTVQAAIRGLVKKGYAAVDDIVYSGTVLTRSYKPLVNQKEYLKSICEEAKGLTEGSLLVSMVEQENDNEVLEKLEEIIQRKMKHREE